MMNLVTGATGLVGSHIVAELLKQGEKVRALYRSEEKKLFVKKIFALYLTDADQAMNDIEWVAGDILDTALLTEAMEGVTRVFHTAGSISFSRAGKKAMLETNIQGTAHVVDACLENPGTDLCHVSSVATLGDIGNGTFLDESSMLKPGKKTPAYALSKFRGELEVWRGINEGLRAVIVNPSVILGPCTQNSSLGIVIRRVGEGLSFYPPGSEGFVDVRDVAAIMVELMKSDISGERFILNAENRSFRDILGLIAQELGKKPPMFRITPIFGRTITITEFIRALLTGTPRQISQQAIRLASSEMLYSNEKIVKKLGVEFIPVEEAVKNMIRNYAKQG
jgi:dihydroflavonol-4-reductase